MERTGNVNVTPIGNLLNVNVKDWAESQKRKAKKRSDDNLKAAKELQIALGASDKDIAFFRKCCNRLNRTVINDLLKRATRPDVHIPLRYFTAAAKAQPEMNNPA